jgi:sugar phosphate isomerase/epimerase
MKLGYNTNGLACHRWHEAVELLAEIGYRSVAITLDHNCLDPYSPQLGADLSRMRELLERLGLRSVIETGARYLLNPRVKHEPTLLTADPDGRRIRIDFLKRSIDVAAELDSEAVSFWSGTLRDAIPDEVAFRRLAAGCREVIDHAAAKSVRLAFEPEPGMFIDTLAQYRRLLDFVDAPHFGLTIDVGHVHCVGEDPIDDRLREWSSRLFNMHIEDMRRGAHEHLRFGEGEIDFVPVLTALTEIGYTGGVHVELSRHSHVAPEVMRESFDFLKEVGRKVKESKCRKDDAGD